MIENLTVILFYYAAVGMIYNAYLFWQLPRAERCPYGHLREEHLYIPESDIALCACSHFR